MIRKEPPFWISLLISRVYTTQFLTCSSAQVLQWHLEIATAVEWPKTQKSSVATKHLATLVHVPTYTVEKHDCNIQLYQETVAQHETPNSPKNSPGTFAFLWLVTGKKIPRRCRSAALPTKIRRSGQPPTRLAKVVRGQVRCQGGQVVFFLRQTLAKIHHHLVMTGLNPPFEKTCVPSMDTSRWRKALKMNKRFSIFWCALEKNTQKICSVYICTPKRGRSLQLSWEQRLQCPFDSMVRTKCNYKLGKHFVQGFSNADLFLPLFFVFSIHTP